jgi:hypothetical protein
MQPPRIAWGAYRLRPPIEIPAFGNAYADVVLHGPDGTWLGTIWREALGDDSLPFKPEAYTDHAGERIPAPPGWESRITERLAWHDEEGRA